MAERVLVVEDSRTQAEALRGLLERAGYEVDVAPSGEAALELVRGSREFDLVLTDIVMPGITGYELCRTLKREREERCPPVLLLTTLADPADIVRGLECGADNYLTKPYAPETLLQRVRHVLDNRRLRRATRSQFGVEVQFLGSSFTITSDKEQILDMLLSSLEELVRANRALNRSQHDLIGASERTGRLHRLAAALNEAITGEEIAAVILRQGMEAAQASAGTVMLLDPHPQEARTLRVAHAFGDEAEVRTAWSPCALDARVPAAEAARSGEAVLLGSAAERAQRYCGLAGAAPEGGFQSWAALPLSTRGETFGVLGLSFRSANRFDAEERALLISIARQCAQALDRARLYEAEATARAEAEQANLAKSEFLAAMSHDLRTPLNAIGGYVDLLDMELRGPLTEAQRGDLARIKQSQQFLLALINDVLSFATVEAGGTRFELANVPVIDVLRAVGSMVAPQAEAKGLRFAYALGEPGLTVHADAERLQQVLLNLVGNAIKFTAAGGQVTIEVTRAREAVHFHVQDTGIGIPREKLERIFEPFVQLRGLFPRTTDGVGLGLAISRTLVRRMGGELTVTSEPGRGSTFTAALPTGSPEPPSPRGPGDAPAQPGGWT